jgi:phage shock protein PspC (stress-responsive transcriptional regulator)
MSLIIALLIVAGCIYFAHKEKIQLASKDSSVLGGVCGGIAKRYGLPPLAIRVTTVALGLVSGGLVLLIYIGLFLSLPRH